MTQEIESGETRPPGPVEDLERRLSLRRSLDKLKRSDAVTRLQARVAHQLATSAARAEARRDRRARREENRDHNEASSLSDLYRRATVSGERARVRTQIQQSAEMRAMRVEKVRRVSLLVMVPVLLAFAAWSTAGVHYGFTALLDVPSGTAMWWTAWGIEPALITIVAGIIVVRAVLRSSGGDLDRRATVSEWGALTASIALNMAGHWPDSVSLSGVVVVVAHSIGPVGAALTAFLIGVIDDAVTNAEPEKDAPTLATMNLKRTEPTTVVEVPAEERESEGPVPSNVTPMKPRIPAAELEAKAREVYSAGMSLNAFRQALGVGMGKAHPLHQKLRAESEATG